MAAQQHLAALSLVGEVELVQVLELGQVLVSVLELILQQALVWADLHPLLH